MRTSGFSRFMAWLIVPFLCGCRAHTARPLNADGDFKFVSGPTHYVITFNNNTTDMTLASENTLAQAAAAFNDDHLGNLHLIGNVSPDEADSDQLAVRRLRKVAALLINRYQVNPSSMTMATGDGGTASLDIDRPALPEPTFDPESTHTKQAHKVIRDPVGLQK